MRSPLAVCVLGLAAACSPAPPPAPLPTPGASASESDATSVAPAPSSATSAVATSDEPVPCGAHDCMQFSSAEAAFKAVLAGDPRVVAVGEAHAQKGTEEVPSATLRFTRDLLPLLTASTSDLVLELMVPDPSCKQETAKVETQVEKPVTNTQASSNKSEFQKMAESANTLGIRPHVLRPTCDNLKQVADAGDEGVLKMLSLIAYLSDDIAKRILARNDAAESAKGVVLYGGAMHNDLAPAAGRELFSFGPDLFKHVGGRYVEIDLIVPEYIKDNDTWRSLWWYAAYDANKLGKKVTLFRNADHTYALVFAKSG